MDATIDIALPRPSGAAVTLFAVPAAKLCSACQFWFIWSSKYGNALWCLRKQAGRGLVEMLCSSEGQMTYRTARRHQ